MRKKDRMNVERWFDGEAPKGDATEHAVQQPGEAADYAAFLQTVRRGVETRKESPAIRDEQFDAFMSGIRENVGASHGSGSRYRGFWALASVATASLLVAVSALVIFTGGSKPVAARTVVEEYSTELEGATVDVETDPDGATVWIKVTTEDLL